MAGPDRTEHAVSPWSSLWTRAGLPADFPTRSATGRLKALLDLPDPSRFLRRLRPDEAVFLLSGIGLDDAAVLLPSLTPIQRQTLLDLESWTAVRFLPDRMDRLLELALDVSRDFALRWLSEMPPEVVALRLMRAFTRVLTSDELERESLPDSGVIPSPDGVFTLILADAGEVPIVQQWLDLLWSLDLEEAHRLLHAIRRETPSSLEEEARRFREARLQDWGFPSSEDRFSLYEPTQSQERISIGETVSPHSGSDLDPETQSMALALATIPPESHLGNLLGRIEDSRRLEWFVHETSLVVNRALGALEDDWSDPEARSRAAAHVLRWMSVGVEVLTRTEGLSLDLLARTVHPADLFRSGFESIRPGHLLARRVVGRLGGVHRLGILEELHGAQVEALAGFPPRVASPLPPHEPQDPRNLSEVQEAVRLAREADVVTTFAIEALGYDPSAPAGPEGGATISSVLATAWAWGILTGEVSIRPLDPEDIQKLRLAAFEGGRIRPALREPARIRTERHDPQEQVVRRLLGRALDRVEEVLGGLDPSRPPDPRFLGDVLRIRDPETPRDPGPRGTPDGDSR